MLCLALSAGQLCRLAAVNAVEKELPASGAKQRFAALTGQMAELLTDMA